MFSPSLDKYRYEYKAYSPETIKDVILEWISEYQDKEMIKQFRKAGLYEPPRLS
jgi:predicted transcriptional regulator